MVKVNEGVSISFICHSLKGCNMGWERIGTFGKNMSLPVHRWFRYSAGYSADWVKHVIKDFKENTGLEEVVVLDPYSGVGTTIIAAEEVGTRAIGIEAHSFIHRVAKCKTNCNVELEDLRRAANEVLSVGLSNPRITSESDTPDLLVKAYPEPETLHQLWGLIDALKQQSYSEEISELIELAIICCVRPCSPVGTANWQYILPNKRKSNPKDVATCFNAVVNQFCSDIETKKSNAQFGELATPILGDCRDLHDVEDASIDLVITSPPYPNNFDYADATRLELTFLGIVENWGGLHDAVRKNLMISSSQHASKVKPDSQKDLESILLAPIKDELSNAYETLSEVRKDRGGKKHYHTMCVSYMLSIAQMIKELDRVMKPTNCRADIVIGDSAPYAVHLPVDKWISTIASQYGFEISETHLRDRNVKWDNRVHKVLLKEVILTLSR
mgnify:CR=1 FL=1